MKHFAVRGVVFIEDRVLLARHTYGMAKDKILIPGGFVKEKELPESDTIEAKKEGCYGDQIQGSAVFGGCIGSNAD